MKLLFRFSVILILSTNSLGLLANSEQLVLNENLYMAVVNNEFEKFEEYLLLGANPNAINDGKWYSSSALCEATRVGNEKYLEFIVEKIHWSEILEGLGAYQTPVDCAINYRNLAAFEKFVSMGIDITAVANPEAPERSQRTLFDSAAGRRSPQILWYLLQRTEPNERQIFGLVHLLERFGGFENTSSVEYYEKLAEWLLDRGIEVNLAPPAPDPRTIVR